MEITGPLGFGERASMEQQGMLQNGMPMHMQPPATMQRPQSGNLQQQMYAKILTDLRSDMGRFAGSWQATFDPRERANLIMQMITALRMLERDMTKCMQTAQRFEATSITSAQNKRQYEKSMQDKLEAIKLKRQQSAQMAQSGAFNGNFNAGNMSIPAGMGMAAMQNNAFGAAPSNQLQQNPQMNGFPAHAHLSRPLQPSQLNAVQQNSLDPSMLSNTPQLANSFAQQVNQAQNDLGMQQLQQGELPAELQAIAQRMMAALPEVKKVELRNQLLSQMSEQQRQNVNQRQIDPLRNWIVSKARQEYLKRNAMGANALANQQQQQNAFQQLQNQAQQQQNQGLPDNLANQNFMAGMNQQLGNIPQNAGDFDLSQLLGQQQSALKLQESGEQVVPISNNNAGMQYMNMIKNIGNQGAPGMMSQLGNNQMNQLTNPATQLQAQALLQQQHARQKQMQEQLIAQRNMQANIRAMNQRNAGQNLNVPTAFNAAPAGSPAMSMLNRPVQQQGNQQAKTPIQNQPRQPQQQNDMNALSMNQAMLSQQGMNTQAEAIKGAPQQVLALLNSLDPSVRNKILAMNPTNRNRALAQLKQMQDRKQQQLSQEFAGVQNTMNTQVDPSSLMRHSPPPGQQNTQSDEAMQAQQRQKQTLRVHAMLSRPLPPNIANQLQISIPPTVQFWHQLRAHIQQNRAVFPAEMPQMLMAAMDRHFSSNSAELQQAIGELIARQKQQLTNQQTAAGVANAQARAQAIQNVPAPVAQMQMPAAQIQALQQLAATGNMPQVTPQDIARFRITHKVDSKVSDDMLRNALLAQKVKELRSRQQAAMSAQQNAAQTAAVTTHGQAMAAQGGILGQTSAGRQPAPSQAPIKPPQPPVRRQLQKTVSDDVMEIANPNLVKPLAAQPQVQMQQAQLPFGQAAQQNKALPKQPVPAGIQAGQPKNLQQQEARAIVYKLYQELGPAPPKGNPIKVQPDEVNEVRKLFQRMWRPVGLLDSTLATSLQVIPNFTEQNAKDLLRAKQILMQNMLDEQGNIREYLSRNFHDLKTISDNILRYYNNLQAVSKNNAARAGQMPQPGQAPAAPAASTPAQPAGRPQAVPARKASNSGKPPAAPTDDDKKFWGVASPHGVPKYETSKPELTADQLKFPPQKRRKVLAGQSGSQPTSQPTTPAQANLAKPATPTVAKQAELPKPQPEKPRVRCPKSDVCEFSITGFETEQQLKEHIDTAHKPIEDPLQFLLESLVEPAKVGIRPASKPVDKPVKVTTPEKTLEDFMLEKYGYGDLIGQDAVKADLDIHQDIFDEVGDVIMSGLQDFDPFTFDDSAKIDWGLGLDDTPSIDETNSPDLTPDSQGSTAPSDISLNDRLRINLQWDAFGAGGMLPESMAIDEPLLAKQDQAISDTDNKDDWNWDTELMNWDFSTAKTTE